jgi:hypothetical protein
MVVLVLVLNWRMGSGSSAGVGRNARIVHSIVWEGFGSWLGWTRKLKIF